MNILRDLLNLLNLLGYQFICKMRYNFNYKDLIQKITNILIEEILIYNLRKKMIIYYSRDLIPKKCKLNSQELY
mgnify:CR=1 FL=1